MPMFSKSNNVELKLRTKGRLKHYRWCPAFFHASLYSLICSACCTWNAFPLSAYFKVELWKFIPFSAAQTAVAKNIILGHTVQVRKP